MYDIFKGLVRFTQVCQSVGIIKALPYGSEKNLYEARLKPFENLQIPRYQPYDDYKARVDQENAEEGSFEKLLTESKESLQKGAQRLKKLEAMAATLRNTELVSNEKLQALQRVAISNSLNVQKLLKSKKKVSQFTLVIEKNNSMDECPALTLVENSGSKK